MSDRASGITSPTAPTASGDTSPPPAKRQRHGEPSASAYEGHDPASVAAGLTRLSPHGEFAEAWRRARNQWSGGGRNPIDASWKALQPPALGAALMTLPADPKDPGAWLLDVKSAADVARTPGPRIETLQEAQATLTNWEAADTDASRASFVAAHATARRAIGAVLRPEGDASPLTQHAKNYGEALAVQALADTLRATVDRAVNLSSELPSDSAWATQLGATFGDLTRMGLVWLALGAETSTGSTPSRPKAWRDPTLGAPFVLGPLGMPAASLVESVTFKAILAVSDACNGTTGVAGGWHGTDPTRTETAATAEAEALIDWWLVDPGGRHARTDTHAIRALWHRIMVRGTRLRSTPRAGRQSRWPRAFQRFHARLEAVFQLPAPPDGSARPADEAVNVEVLGTHVDAGTFEVRLGIGTRTACTVILRSQTSEPGRLHVSVRVDPYGPAHAASIAAMLWALHAASKSPGSTEPVFQHGTAHVQLSLCASDEPVFFALLGRVVGDAWVEEGSHLDGTLRFITALEPSVVEVLNGWTEVQWRACPWMLNDPHVPSCLSQEAQERWLRASILDACETATAKRTNALVATLMNTPDVDAFLAAPAQAAVKRALATLVKKHACLNAGLPIRLRYFRDEARAYAELQRQNLSATSAAEAADGYSDVGSDLESDPEEDETAWHALTPREFMEALKHQKPDTDATAQAVATVGQWVDALPRLMGTYARIAPLASVEARIRSGENPWRDLSKHRQPFFPILSTLTDPLARGAAVARMVSSANPNAAVFLQAMTELDDSWDEHLLPVATRVLALGHTDEEGLPSTETLFAITRRFPALKAAVAATFLCANHTADGIVGVFPEFLGQPHDRAAVGSRSTPVDKLREAFPHVARRAEGFSPPGVRMMEPEERVAIAAAGLARADPTESLACVVHVHADNRGALLDALVASMNPGTITDAFEACPVETGDVLTRFQHVVRGVLAETDDSDAWRAPELLQHLRDHCPDVAAMVTPDA